MTTIISTVNAKDQRYPTVGDWQFSPNLLKINVSDLGDWRYEFLIGLHEFVEAMLCKRWRVRQQDVDDFDMKHPDISGEPGDDPRAPYYKQHQIATAVERLVAAELGVNWNAYEDEVEKSYQRSKS